MTRLIFDGAAYFATGVTDEQASTLGELRWALHPGAAGTWWTRSPYLAAPLWGWRDPADAPLAAALGTYAWNYWSSFAQEPLQGTGIDRLRLPAGSSPYPFQLAGIQRAAMRKRILIADEPGCGKSLQALGVANLWQPKRIVIGCPTFLTENWAAECEKWLVDPRSITILGAGKRMPPDRGVVILPYSRGHVWAKHLLSGPPVDHLIMDEPDQLKTPTARRSVPWLGPEGLVARAERVTAIGGSPAPNNPLELHGLISALSPETMGTVSREAFKGLYCSVFKGTAQVARRGGGAAAVQFEKVSGRNEAALNAELRASGVMVRRLKVDVLRQLPPKHTYLVHLSPTSEIESLVREEANLYDMLTTRLMPTAELMAIRGHVSNVRARLGVLKAPKVAEYVRWIFDSGENRVVLFMLHLQAIEEVRRLFENTQIVTRVLTGAQTVKERNDHVKGFQQPGGAELIIGQMTAAGTGLTMTSARFVPLGEISWVPAVNDQAIDRVHRITQTQQVEAPILTFPHAVEERVIQSNARKSISAQKILDVNLQNLLT